jgi:hypothetical protein
MVVHRIHVAVGVSEFSSQSAAHVAIAAHGFLVHESFIVGFGAFDAVCSEKFGFRKGSDKFKDWRDYSYISQKLLIVDSKGNYIPKKFAIEVYKIEPRDNAVDITGVEYLTKVDSLGLGYNIVESEKRLIDWFTYTQDIAEYTDILLERLTILMKRYDDVLNSSSLKGQLQFQFKGDEEQEYRDKVSMNRSLCQDRIEHLEE